MKVVFVYEFKHINIFTVNLYRFLAIDGQFEFVVGEHLSS